MRGLVFIPLLILCGHFAIAVGSFPDSLSWGTDFSEVPGGSGWMNLGQVRALPDGNVVLITDSIHPYGAGYEWSWSDSLPVRSVVLQCSAKLRSSAATPAIQWVLSVDQHGRNLLWDGLDLGSQIIRPDTLLTVQAEFKIPANFLRNGNILKAYLYQPGPNAYIETDEVSFQIKRWPLTSFIPERIIQPEPIGQEVLIYSGNRCKVSIKPDAGVVMINKTDGEPWIRNINVYTEVKQDKKVSGYRSLEFLKDFVVKDTHWLCFEVKDDLYSARLELGLRESDPTLQWRFHTQWKRSLELVRQAIVLDIAGSPLQALDETGRCIMPGNEDESWLGHGAVFFGDSSTAFGIPYPKELSSLQVDWVNNRVWLNTDWSLDHPLLHWPQEEKSRNRFVDYSCSRYKRSDRCSAVWETWLGVRADLPAIQDRPSGFEGTFIWTEHADYSDLQLQRAVMYGVDSLSDPTLAHAGFVAHSIPMTKSVFYDNPDHVSNGNRHGSFPGEIATLRGTPGFEALMRSLEESGNEIALHTPEHFTSSNKQMDEALQFMRSRFGTSTWIDHGYDNAPTSNREDLVCDGLNRASDFYALDLWKRYGITSAWNCYFEDTAVYAPFAFDSRLSTPYAGISSRFPAPVYWKHASRSGDLLHWRTTTTLDPPDASLWSFYLGEQRIEDLLQLHGTYIAHCYPARVDSTNGFYRLHEGHWEIDPAFDQILALQSRYRGEGRLWLPVIRDYLHYQQQRQQVRISPADSGWQFFNGSGELIKGFTLSTAAKLLIDSHAQSIKSVGIETYYSFDLQPGETVSVKIQ